MIGQLDLWLDLRLNLRLGHRRRHHAGPGLRCSLGLAAAAAVIAGCQGAGPPAGGRTAGPPVTTTTSAAPTAVPTTSTLTTAVGPTTSAPTDAGWQLLVPGLERLTTPSGVVMRIDLNLLEVALVPGTAEPGGAFPEGGMVTADRRPALVMATNAGFKRADAHGGEMVDGRTIGTLVPGAASLVIRSDGTVDVGPWGTGGDTIASSPAPIAVLQNLLPLVDQGRPAPDLGVNIIQRWGVSFRPALPVAVWRSGAGIDSRGRLLYAIGVNAVPAQLAQLLITGGAIRAMQLDINHLWVFGVLFSHPDPKHPDLVQAQPVLPGMGPAPSHVLAPGPRDFLAVYGRPPATGGL